MALLAGDPETVRIAKRIATEERTAAAAIRAQFEPALLTALRGKGEHA